ncbi:MAG: 23S rRNA (guanosine(2251)-2'-O)-methyltransferase RlmB [Deltaproteobacteria bacterium]|nr:23S rRNA (guanosine(2251)-2'-O)-methyltransferase RlmB [Deltaproteobacteria bacterium]
MNKKRASPRNNHSRTHGARPRFKDGTRIVVGRNAVREVLRHDPGRILELYVAPGNQERWLAKSELQRSIHQSAIHEVSKHEISKYSGTDSHQGVMAVVKERARLPLKDLLKKELDLVLVLDAINDPQNLGALLRAAECFAVDAVVLSPNRGCGITPIAAKSSVGASELLEIVEVSNLADAVRKLKEAGYWVIAADSGPSSQPLNEFEAPERCVLMLGSEGEGLQPLLKKEADMAVRIEMEGVIDSLNVSQACAIFLHELRRQRKGS